MLDISPVVSLLQESCPVPEVHRLPVVPGRLDYLVIEDGAREQPGGGLHQVPGGWQSGALSLVQIWPNNVLSLVDTFSTLLVCALS